MENRVSARSSTAAKLITHKNKRMIFFTVILLSKKGGFPVTVKKNGNGLSKRQSIAEKN
jgi:hypothetical protein